MSFLKSIFGPSKDDIWGSIAKEIGAKYKDGGFFGKDLLTAKHKNWSIYLDTYTQSNGKSSTTYTRIRAPYIANERIHFRIYEENFLSPVSKWMGFQDIKIGDADFDKRYMIKGDNERRIREIFNSASIKQIMMTIHNITIQTKDKEGYFGPKYGDHADLLYFQKMGIVKDRTELLSLYALFCLLLDRLAEIGCAKKDDPDILIT